MRTFVYFDGFNFYYGAVKGTRKKWCDLTALSEKIVPASHSIEKVKYFTAIVSGAVDPSKPGKQRAYLNALQHSGIEIVKGHFLNKVIFRPIINLPIANREIGSGGPVLRSGTYRVGSKNLQIGKMMDVGKHPNARPGPAPACAEFHTMEEKGSDVNLACHLLDDAFNNLYDVALVISNDTDLVAPIEMITNKYGKEVIIVNPSGRTSSTPLISAASRVRHLPKSFLNSTQFPNRIPGTNIVKPPSW